jgi:hypothetical protein
MYCALPRSGQNTRNHPCFNLDPAVDRLSFFGEGDVSSLWFSLFASPNG